MTMIDMNKFPEDASKASADSKKASGESGKVATVEAPASGKKVTKQMKTAEQKSALENLYRAERFPSDSAREILAKELGLSDKQLQMWFSHRRRKDRLSEEAKVKQEAKSEEAKPVAEVKLNEAKFTVDLNEAAKHASEDYAAAVLASERDDAHLTGADEDDEQDELLQQALLARKGKAKGAGAAGKKGGKSSSVKVVIGGNSSVQNLKVESSPHDPSIEVKVIATGKGRQSTDPPQGAVQGVGATVKGKGKELRKLEHAIKDSTVLEDMLEDVAVAKDGGKAVKASSKCKGTNGTPVMGEAPLKVKSGIGTRVFKGQGGGQSEMSSEEEDEQVAVKRGVEHVDSQEPKPKRRRKSAKLVRAEKAAIQSVLEDLFPGGLQKGLKLSAAFDPLPENPFSPEVLAKKKQAAKSDAALSKGTAAQEDCQPSISKRNKAAILDPENSDSKEKAKQATNAEKSKVSLATPEKVEAELADAKPPELQPEAVRSDAVRPRVILPALQHLQSQANSSTAFDGHASPYGPGSRGPYGPGFMPGNEYAYGQPVGDLNFSMAQAHLQGRLPASQGFQEGRYSPGGASPFPPGSLTAMPRPDSGNYPQFGWPGLNQAGMPGFHQAQGADFSQISIGGLRYPQSSPIMQPGSGDRYSQLSPALAPQSGAATSAFLHSAAQRTPPAGPSPSYSLGGTPFQLMGTPVSTYSPGSLALGSKNAPLSFSEAGTPTGDKPKPEAKLPSQVIEDIVAAVTVPPVKGRGGKGPGSRGGPGARRKRAAAAAASAAAAAAVAIGADPAAAAAAALYEFEHKKKKDKSVEKKKRKEVDEGGSMDDELETLEEQEAALRARAEMAAAELAAHQAALEATKKKKEIAAAERAKRLEAEEVARQEKKRKFEELRLVKEAEMLEKKQKKEQERLETARRREEEWKKREVEREEFLRRREVERAERERLRELERVDREKRREVERFEREKLKEAAKAEKERAKEIVRQERQEARHRAAQERERSRKSAREALELPDDEVLELQDAAEAIGMELRSQGPVKFTSEEHVAGPLTQYNSELVRRMEVFPPEAVALQRPFSGAPWQESEEAVADLIMCWSFVNCFSDRLGLWAFTMEEFAEALHAFDARLLGEVHLALLQLLIDDMEEAREAAAQLAAQERVDEKAVDSGHSVLDEAAAWGFDLCQWRAHLNALTWPEVLRQWGLAAGFGPKRRSKADQEQKADSAAALEEEEDEGGNAAEAVAALRSGQAAEAAVAQVLGKKGRSHAGKRAPARLLPGSCKYAAYHILCGLPGGGMLLPELIRQIQEAGLRDFSTNQTPEATLAGALSRDPMFAKVATSTYAVRACYRKSADEARAMLAEAVLAVQQAHRDGQVRALEVDEAEGGGATMRTRSAAKRGSTRRKKVTCQRQLAMYRRQLAMFWRQLVLL